MIEPIQLASELILHIEMQTIEVKYYTIKRIRGWDVCEQHLPIILTHFAAVDSVKDTNLEGLRSEVGLWTEVQNSTRSAAEAATSNQRVQAMKCSTIRMNTIEKHIELKLPL
jgi:hypothetical protein